MMRKLNLGHTVISELTVTIKISSKNTHLIYGISSFFSALISLSISVKYNQEVENKACKMSVFVTFSILDFTSVPDQFQFSPQNGVTKRAIYGSH